MATNYPSGLDSLSNPAGTDALSTGHAAQHGNANDAIEAIEGELGLNPRGGSATVKARFDAIEANGWVTNARVADATITDAKLDHARVTFSNTSVVCAATTRVLVQTGTMSASRSVTLPAANAVSAGTEIVVVDESGSVTTTNTIVITRAGSDTINGAASVSIGAAYGWRRLISDGTSKWSVDGGVVRLSDSGTITSGMIADGTITGTDIASGTITSANITDATITGADIASGTVTSTNILDGTIVNADINASAAIDKTKISGTAVTVADSGTVTSAMIADGTITGTDIASGTVATANVADGAITPIKTSSGYVAKAALYTATNDDRVIDCTTGTYTITLPTAASQTGRTFIIRNSGTGVITIGRTGAETIAGATSQTLAGYGHLEVVSNGTNWLVLRGTYTDESVGRRIFTWDTVNNRWQMTYGDTGWRVPSSWDAAGTITGDSLGTNWGPRTGVAGGIYIRRVGSNVEVRINNVQANTSNPTTLWTITTGFDAVNATDVIMAVHASATANIGASVSGGAIQRLSNGVVTNGAVIYNASMTYTTTTAWPASLPGSASGSIPQ